MDARSVYVAEVRFSFNRTTAIDTPFPLETHGDWVPPPLMRRLS
jgi:hypothetical protein